MKRIGGAALTPLLPLQLPLPRYLPTKDHVGFWLTRMCREIDEIKTKIRATIRDSGKTVKLPIEIRLLNLLQNTINQLIEFAGTYYEQYETTGRVTVSEGSAVLHLGSVTAVSDIIILAKAVHTI